MKRFVFLDPSIKKTGGHYLEYANRVLDEAVKLGYKTLIVANRDYSAARNESGHDVLPWFHRDFFENNDNIFRAVKRPLNQLKNRLVNWKIKDRFFLKFNRLILWLIPVSFKSELEQSLSNDSVRSEKIHAIFYSIFKVAFLGASIHSLYFLKSKWTKIVLGTFLKAIYFLVAGIAFILKTLLAILASPVVSAYLLHDYLAFRRRSTFSQDLNRLFDEKLLKDNDLVVIPTAGIGEVEGVRQLLDKRPEAMTLSWRLIFRRDVIPGIRTVDIPPSKRPGAFNALRKSLRCLKEIAYTPDIKFFTDTDELTQDYNMLGVYPFQTTTIPVDEELRHSQGSGGNPLSILYMGDARNEKGFPEIPLLIEKTMDLVSEGRISYQCQSDFNIPGGERASARAMDLLKARQETTGLELIPGPINTGKYNTLIKSAGVILLPYQRKNYQARSSGIFAEAVTAGIPCLVTAGTFMARLAEHSRQENFAAINHSGTLEILCSKEVHLADLTTKESEVILFAGKSEGLREEADLYLKVDWPTAFTRSLFIRIEATGYELPNKAAHVGATAESLNRNRFLNHYGVKPTRLARRRTLKHLEEKSQTLAVSPGLAGCGLIKIKGQAVGVRMSFSAKEVGVSDKTPFTVSLAQSSTALACSGGIGIFEDRNDLSDVFRDLIDHYDYHRQCMAKIAERLWPLFSPARLVEQFAVGPSPAERLWPESAAPKAMGITDVSLGYGSPQVPSLAELLERLYKRPALILERDEATACPCARIF